MIPGRSGGGRTERGAARVGVNVRRGADNDERGYRLILIMESVQVKRSIFPPAHVHPVSTPSPAPLPFPVTLRIIPRRLSFYPCSLDLRDSAISISRHLFTPFYLLCRSSSPFRAGRSLISISSRGVKNIESIELRRPHSRLSSPVVCSTLCGVRGEGCANVHETFAIASSIVRVTTILRKTWRNRYLYQHGIYLFHSIIKCTIL